MLPLGDGESHVPVLGFEKLDLAGVRLQTLEGEP